MELGVERSLRQTWAFMFRGYHLTRRYISWVIVFNFYALTGSAAVALIGVAAHDHQLTLTLVVGALLWNFLSTLYNEIAMSVAYERWEGTLEYTSLAPVSRLRHLVGIGNPATTPQRLAGGPLSAVAFELSVLAMMGVVLIPLGLWVFGRVERWAKHTGRLKRTG